MHLVPHADVYNFLIDNNRIIPSPEVALINVPIIIKNNPHLKCPTSILDYLSTQDLDTKELEDKYRSSEILTSGDVDLFNLACKLKLPDVDRSRIVRILGYIKKLDNDKSVFDFLTYDVLSLIVSRLDTNTIRSICRVSKYFDKYCRSPEFINVLTLEIRKYFDVSLASYDVKDLMRICVMKKFHHIYNRKSYHPDDYSIVITLKGVAYLLQDDATPVWLVNLSNIIQVYPTLNEFLLLDAQGNVFLLAKNQTHISKVSPYPELFQIRSTTIHCGKILLLNNIAEIIGESTFLDNSGDQITFDTFCETHQGMSVNRVGMIRKLEKDEIYQRPSKGTFYVNTGYGYSLDENGNFYRLVRDLKSDLICGISDVVQIIHLSPGLILLTGDGKIHHYVTNFTIVPVDLPTKIIEIAPNFAIDECGSLYHIKYDYSIGSKFKHISNFNVFLM